MVYTVTEKGLEWLKSIFSMAYLRSISIIEIQIVPQKLNELKTWDMLTRLIEKIN